MHVGISVKSIRTRIKGEYTATVELKSDDFGIIETEITITASRYADVPEIVRKKLFDFGSRLAASADHPIE